MRDPSRREFLGDLSLLSGAALVVTAAARLAPLRARAATTPPPAPSEAESAPPRNRAALTALAMPPLRRAL